MALCATTSPPHLTPRFAGVRAGGRRAGGAVQQLLEGRGPGEAALSAHPTLLSGGAQVGRMLPLTTNPCCSCLKVGRDSMVTRAVREKHVVINRKTLECRARMRDLLRRTHDPSE